MFEVIWTETASEQRIEIMKFWIEHNQSKTYSEKILEETLKTEKLLTKNPFIGTLTDLEEIRRILVLKNFSMFYRIEKNVIQVLVFRDNRRDPNELEI